MKKLFDLTVFQERDMDIGRTCDGDALVSPTDKGRFEGDDLNGELVPIGMGVTYTPSPGINDIETNMLLRTFDDAYILMELCAYFDTDLENEEKLIRGEWVDPNDYYYKGTVKFKTSHPAYRWLERKVCVCRGVIENWEKLKFEVYMF